MREIMVLPVGDYALLAISTRPVQIDDKLITTALPNTGTRPCAAIGGTQRGALSATGHGDRIR